MQLEKIGKYKIVGKIGQGAMGEVYKAHDTVLNRFVAIKTIAGTLGSDEQFRKRFHREAQSAAQLNHRNIVTVFEFSQEQSMVYMVMELLEGTDLKDIIVKKAQVRLEDKLSIIEQMCDGLGYAHDRGVVHRDLKPANIHVLQNGTVKIMDFGLARLGVSEITKTGTVMGTPNYMSPEQVRGEKVDSRSDIFSVGAVMYELLAGHKPFEAETMHSVLFQVLDQEPQPLRKWIPDMPMPVAHVVEKALAKDPKMRYQTAGEMRGGLRNARRVMAAGRAAEAALGGPTALAEAEATLTRGPAVPATYVSTDARDWGVTGATALNLRPAKDAEAPTTERPDPTMLEAVEEPPPSRAGVYAVGALVALIAVGAGTFAWIRTRTAPQVDPAELAKEQEAIIREQLVAGQVELAQTELANKSYAAAVAQADRVLGLDAGNAVAAEVKKRAEAALREVEAAAAAARSAFAKGDTAGATESLKRLMTMDPSHAAVTELSTALNRHFEAQAKDARGVAQASRAEAQRLRATAFDGFAAGDRLASAAEAKLGSRDFAEATQKFLEASEGYGRARRAAEAAEVAARKAAAVPSSLPSSSARPPSSSPSGLASITPSLPPVTTTSPSTLPVSPTPSAVTTAPSVGISPAPSASASAAGPDPAIRRAIADWGRAIETKDMALFKHVWPGLTGDQEKALRDSFKNVKSQQVALSVEGVDVKGSTATVRISRQDTVNGQQQKPRQHTVRMSQRPSGWVIESLGQ